MRDISHYILELTENSLDAGAGTIDVTVSISDTELDITVVDDGEGIASDMLEAIARRELPATGSSGMGLRLIGQLTDSYGGDMSIQSDTFGTRVRVTLPLSVLEHHRIGRLGDTLAVSMSSARVRLRLIAPSMDLSIDTVETGDLSPNESLVHFRDVINKYSSLMEDRQI